MKKCVRFFAITFFGFAFFFIFSVKTTAKAEVPSGVETSTMYSEISNFLNSHSDFEKVEDIKDMELQIDVPSKVQLFRKKISSKYTFEDASITATYVNLGHSFSVTSGTSSSTSKIDGSFFSGGGGFSIDGSVFGIPATNFEFTMKLVYSKEMTNTEEHGYSSSVSYGINNIKQTGTYRIYNNVEAFDYVLLIFSIEDVYVQVPNKDKNGKITGYSKKYDHKEWALDEKVEFSNVVDKYFSFGKE